MRSWYLFGAYTTFITLVLIGAYMNLIPRQIAVVPMYDSIGHFILYGIWFFLLHKALREKLVVVIPLSFLILFPVVALEELAQTLSSSRTFSLVDLFWGFLGMCVFWLVSNRCNMIKRV